MARELIILPRFKRDYRNARKHAEFDVETLEYVFDALISGERLPPALRAHRLGKRNRVPLGVRSTLALNKAAYHALPGPDLGENVKEYRPSFAWLSWQSVAADVRTDTRVPPAEPAAMWICCTTP